MKENEEDLQEPPSMLNQGMAATLKIWVCLFGWLVFFFLHLASRLVSLCTKYGLLFLGKLYYTEESVN